MSADLYDEIRTNYRFFEGAVSGLMAQYAGQYALLRSGALVDVFRRPQQAIEAGSSRFADGRFSIQRVVDRPLDLGFMADGAGDGTVD